MAKNLVIGFWSQFHIHFQAILKKRRFDIPPGLENIPADWAKVIAVVQDALTQTRAKVKKLIDWSLKVNKSDKTYAPQTQQQNIFDLTKAIVKGTQCSVSVVLCARIALMRKVYLKHPGVKYWNKLDDRLALIREEASGDAKKITKAFRQLLTADQDKHGVKNYELDETLVDEFQQEVDDLIDVGTMDAATSVQGAASPQL
ncbi:hypothetical protein B0H13DRAFT_2392979 [Mycena leptocephala]|nr:hypothetical protein B0H13DRAFT_2392979 [Mycena leptocephala]